MRPRVVATLLCAALLCLLSATASAQVILPFNDGRHRNWQVLESTVVVKIQQAAFEQARPDARDFIVIASSRYIRPSRQEGAPNYLRDCLLKPGTKIPWIHAVTVPAAKMTSHTVKLTGAAKAYYVFVVVRTKAGAYNLVPVEMIAGESRMAAGDGAVAVALPYKLSRPPNADVAECR